MNPLNEEHINAAQSNADENRKKFLESLSPEDQRKFNLIEKCAETMAKEGVLFYLFPMLPSMQFPNKNQVWQWNSLTQAMSYDADGKITKDSLSVTKNFHEAFFAFLFNQFHTAFGEGKELQEKLDSLPAFFFHCLKTHGEYLMGKPASFTGEKEKES